MKEFKMIVGTSGADTYVYVDNKQVGYIQDIKVHVGVDTSPQIEIVFPDLRPFNHDAAKRVAEQVELLKDLPQVKTSLVKLKMPAPSRKGGP